MIPSSNCLKNFIQIHIDCDKEIEGIRPTGLILDGVINFTNLLLIIDKYFGEEVKIVKTPNNTAFLIFDMEIKLFLGKIFHQLHIHYYDFYSIFLNDSLSLHIVKEFQQQSVKILYSNSTLIEKNNITYFCFNYDNDIFNLVEKLEDKDKIIEISTLKTQPKLFFFSISNYTKLLKIYLELIQNDIWPIYSFKPKMNKLIHKEIIYERNVQFTKLFSKDFPLFEPEKYLFYIGFIEPIIKKHERIKNCNKLYDIFDITDIQISSLYDENSSTIRTNQKESTKKVLFPRTTIRTFLGFDDQFRCLHSFDYFNQNTSNFDVILIKKNEFTFNFQIKHNLYYIEVPNSFFNSDKKSKTIDLSILYSIDSIDVFNDSNYLSTFFSFNNEQSFLFAKELFSKLKGLRKINRIRMIEPDDYRSFFDAETSNFLYQSNLSYLIFNLKVKNNKVSKDFQYKNAKQIIPDVLCLKDNRRYTIVGLQNNEEREKLYVSLKNSIHSKKVVRYFYPETSFKKPKIPKNDNNNVAVDFVPINREKSTNQKVIDFSPKMNGFSESSKNLPHSMNQKQPSEAVKMAEPVFTNIAPELNSTEKFVSKTVDFSNNTMKNQTELSKKQQPKIKEFRPIIKESNKATQNSKPTSSNSIFEPQTNTQQINNGFSQTLTDEKSVANSFNQDKVAVVEFTQTLPKEKVKSIKDGFSQTLTDEKSVANSFNQDKLAVVEFTQILPIEKVKSTNDGSSQTLTDEKSVTNSFNQDKVAVVEFTQTLPKEKVKSIKDGFSQTLTDEKSVTNSFNQDKLALDEFPQVLPIEKVNPTNNGFSQISPIEKVNPTNNDFTQILRDEKEKSRQVGEAPAPSQHKPFSQLLEEASKTKGKPPSSPPEPFQPQDASVESESPQQDNSSQISLEEVNQSKSSPETFSDSSTNSLQRNPNIKEFAPIPNLHYIYIEELDPKPYSSQSSNAHIFGIDSIDDVQRFYYMPKTNKVCTFLGFLDRDDAEDAKINPNFKSTKNKKPLDYKPQIKVQIPSSSSSLKIIPTNSKAEKAAASTATESKSTDSSQPKNADAKKSSPNSQLQQTEIKRPQKSSPISIIAPEKKQKTTSNEDKQQQQPSSTQTAAASSASMPVSISPKPSPPVIVFAPKKQASSPLKKSTSEGSEKSDKKPLSSSSSSEISVKKPSPSSDISIKRPSSSSSEFSVKPTTFYPKPSIPLKSSSSSIPSSQKMVTEFEIKKPSQSIQINSSSSTNNDNESTENSPYFSPKPNLLYFYFSEATKSKLTILETKQQSSLFGVHHKDMQRYVRHPTKDDHLLYTFFGFDTNEEREIGIAKIKSVTIKMNSPICKFESADDDDDVANKTQNSEIHIKNHSPSKTKLNELTVELHDLSIPQEMREAISKAIFEKNLNQNSHTGVINTRDQNIIQTVYSSQSSEVIDTINGIIKKIICNDFNIRLLEELKDCPFLYFDEVFVPKDILKSFICYLKTIPGVCNIQRNVFYQNKIASFIYYQKANKKTIINSIKNFFIKNDLLFDKRKYLLKNTLIINEELILQNKKDFEAIIDQIKKIDIKIINIERNKLFVYESHELNKLLQQLSFICFENEKDKTIALNHINQIAFKGNENILKCDLNLHYAKIQDISLSPQMKRNMKDLYDTIPNLVVKKNKLLSIENPIVSTYLGFKSIRSLNYGIALLKFRLLLLNNNNNPNLLFFKPKRKTKYIRMHQELFNEISNNSKLLKNIIQQIDLQRNCQELENGVLKSFAYIGFASDSKHYSKILKELENLKKKKKNSSFAYQEVDNDTNNNNINNNDDDEKLIDADEICYFDGMF